MIPDNPSVDDAWSEFERYSTNDYVRRLLDLQAVAVSNPIITETSWVIRWMHSDEFVPAKFSRNMRMRVSKDHARANGQNKYDFAHA